MISLSELTVNSGRFFYGRVARVETCAGYQVRPATSGTNELSKDTSFRSGYLRRACWPAATQASQTVKDPCLGRGEFPTVKSDLCVERNRKLVNVSGYLRGAVRHKSRPLPG
jgi:hypothetical protein